MIISTEFFVIANKIENNLYIKAYLIFIIFNSILFNVLLNVINIALGENSITFSENSITFRENSITFRAKTLLHLGRKLYYI